MFEIIQYTNWNNMKMFMKHNNNYRKPFKIQMFIVEINEK